MRADSGRGRQRTPPPPLGAMHVLRSHAIPPHDLSDLHDSTAPSPFVGGYSSVYGKAVSGSPSTILVRTGRVLCSSLPARAVRWLASAAHSLHVKWLSALQWAVAGVGLLGMYRRLWRLQRKKPPSPDVASHPVEDAMGEDGFGVGEGGRGGASRSRRWVRRLATRIAVVAVRAASMPLAHRMLTRTMTAAGLLDAQQAAAVASVPRAREPSASSTPQRGLSFSRADSTVSQSGDTTRGLHHGRGGGGGGVGSAASSSRSNAARVLHWLDPSAGLNEYMLAQHPELLLQRQQQQLGNPRSSRDGARSQQQLGALVASGVAAASPSYTVNLAGAMRRQASTSGGVLPLPLPPASTQLPVLQRDAGGRFGGAAAETSAQPRQAVRPPVVVDGVALARSRLTRPIV